MQLWKFIKKIFKSKSWEEQYLSAAVDHFDLEQRIRKLDRRQVNVGPFGFKDNYRINRY